MLNQKVYAVTTTLVILPEHTAKVVVAFTDSKKFAKKAKKAMIKRGFIPFFGSDIAEIDPTDWAVTFDNPTMPNSFPMPLFKGYRFIADAEQVAELFRQVLPQSFVVDVVKFDETIPYQHYLKNTTTAEQMGAIYA